MNQIRRHSPLASRDGRARIHATAQVRDCTLGRFVDIGERAVLAECDVGDYTYVERGAEGIYTSIGKFCAVAAYSRLNALAHPSDRITQHKISYRPNEYFVGAKLDKTYRETRRQSRVSIGHDVWIGHGAVVMPGIAIGHGAVIAAGAVVTKDVPSFAIVAGVPARRIKWRFSAAIRERILSLAWWDWDHDRLGAAVEDMQKLPVAEFLDRHG